jgi:hypothetical protein
MQLILSRIYTHANSYVYECMCVCLLFDDEAKLYNKLNFSKKSNNFLSDDCEQLSILKEIFLKTHAYKMSK